ncbi:MAG: hypothetical protein ABW110_04595, partial [Steroidobacteraceae bacterium]
VQDCDTVDYSKLGADIGVVTMYDMIEENFVAHRRLLSAGMNVICHGSESYYPQVSNPEIARQLDALAKAKNVTFTGTGVWDMSRIWSALLVAGVCDEIQSIHNSSLTNLATFGTAIMINAGVGATPEELAKKMATTNPTVGGQFYRFILNLVLNRLGYTIKSSTVRQEPFILEKPLYCEALKKQLPAGVCAGLRGVVEATTWEGVTGSASIETRLLLNDSEREHMQWQIKGNMLSPSVRVERDNGHYMQALSVFNRIQDVIAAPPGLQLLTDLPPVMRHSAMQ